MVVVIDLPAQANAKRMLFDALHSISLCLAAAL